MVVLRTVFKTMTLQVIMMVLIALMGTAAYGSPVIKNGVLDLREWSFTKDGWIVLRGDMLFYWHEWIDPGKPIPFDKSDAILPMTQSWTTLKKNGTQIPSYGYASYGFKILLPHEKQDLAFEFGGLMSASRVYVDGRNVYQSGVPDQDERLARSKFYSDIAVVGPSSGEMNVVVHISNYDFFRPGGYTPLYMGLKSQVVNRFQRERFAGISVIGATLIIAIYHFMLYALRRKDKINLYFGMTCFFQTFYAASMLQIVYFIVPDGSAEVAWKLLHIGWFLSISGFSAYHAKLFPEENTGKVAFFSLVLAAISTVFVSMSDIRVHQYFGHLWTPYSAVIVFYTVYKTWQSWRAKREGATIFLVGVLLLGVTVINDLLVANAVINFVVLTPYGIFACSCAQALILSSRSAKVFSGLEASESQIRLLHQSLIEQELVRTAFFQNVSHELRTPLNGIMGFLELLIKDHYGTLTQEIKGQLRKVGRLSEALKLQVNTILELAKFKKGDEKLSYSFIPLQEIAEEVQILSEGLMQNQTGFDFAIETSWKYGENPPLYIHDREKLMTILRNLLGNAFKFCDRRRENHVTLRLLVAENAVLILEVEDTGIGIETANLSVIFEEFRQVEGDARRRYEGTGLGLALVRTLAESMGGKIEVKSVLGQGSLFRVILPSAEEAKVGVPAPSRSMHEGQTHSAFVERVVVTENKETSPACPTVILVGDGVRHILIIDDNAINCELIRDIVHGAGYHTTIAYSGGEGLEKMKSSPPDLVLLDLMMPQISGEDVLNLMRQDATLKNIPVIIMTARTSADDRLRGLGFGADDYLAKPIVHEELKVRLRNIFYRIDLVAARSEHVAMEKAIATAQSVYTILGGVDMKIPGIDIAHFYKSAEQIGGDWLGVHHDKSSKRAYFLIGDVTGHGMSSALLTLAVAGAFIGSGSVLGETHSLPSLAESMRLIWSALDQTVEQLGSKMEKAMTMALVGIELSTGCALYLNAGHTPVLRIGQGQFSALALSSHLLGMGGQNYNDPKFLEFTLNTGDLLFFYTDGLIENSGEDGKTVKIRSVRTILQNAKSCHEAKEQILQVAQNTWNDSIMHDDTSFMILQWKSIEQPRRLLAQVK